jgi:hypothetical protein
MIEGTEVCKLGLAENDCAAWKTREDTESSMAKRSHNSDSRLGGVIVYNRECLCPNVQMYQGHKWTPSLPQEIAML